MSGKLSGGKADEMERELETAKSEMNTPESESDIPSESVNSMAPGSVASSVVPTNAPETIRAFDQDGREVLVPREEWRTRVLPGMLAELYDHPDQLYMVIMNSLSDGFVAEVAEAAEHLYKTDPLPARGACTLGVVLIQLQRLDEAEQVLGGFVSDNGEDGSVLVNLAKVHAARGQQEQAEATLWRALEVEPNLDHGLAWYVGLAQERGGEHGAQEALERIARMPASWRAQLWLARAQLTGGDLSQARQLYTDALERTSRPVPPDFLLQMSGDLGGHGHLAELIEFTASHFVAEIHGLPVGGNLLKALIDLGHIDQAERVKNALGRLGRPDWKDALGFWTNEIEKRRDGGARAPAAAHEIQIGMLRIDGPVWLPPGSPARGIFGSKAPDAPRVTFLGGTAEVPSQLEGASSTSDVPGSEALGRMTRALPLYLAEQTEMRTAAVGRAMLPWAVGQVTRQPDGSAAGQPSGFVVSGAPWPDETAVQAAASDPANRSDYVVSVHVDAEVEPWTIELAFVRTEDGMRIGELDAEFLPDSPERGLPSLADEVVDLLRALGPASESPDYKAPDGAAFGPYLLRLEQLLTLRCATMDGVTAQFLVGEQEMLEEGMELCRAEPKNIAARLLLVETFGEMSKVRPQIASESREEVQRFMTQNPMPVVDAVLVSN